MYGLGKQIAGRKVGQHLAHESRARLVGVNIYVLFGHNPGKPVVCALQLRAPCPEKIDELLGTLLAADGPQTAAFAACEDDAIIVVCAYHVNL